MDYTEKEISILKNGGVGVIRTDTLYGIVGSALNLQAVERIYKLKKRNPTKPFIVLIDGIEALQKFNIEVSDSLKKKLQTYWPGPVSIILPCPNKDFEYLHRGTDSIAFRLPKDIVLGKLLQETGPLVAPSANREGDTPAQNIQEAKKYFGEAIDFYLDGGDVIDASPSSLLRLEQDGSVTTLR